MVPKLNKYICCSAQFFFFLSDNEISWGSHVPNYVQFQTAQHSYSETAVKSNVGVTDYFFSPLPAAHWVRQLARSSYLPYHQGQQALRARLLKNGFL